MRTTFFRCRNSLRILCSLLSRVVIVDTNFAIIDSRKTVHNPLNSSNEQIQGEVQELVIENGCQINFL